MNIKQYKRARAFVALFVGAIVSIATTQDSYLLAIAGVFTGMLFMILVRSKTKIIVDEREKTIREKAAQLTYSIYAPTIGLGSFLLILGGKRLLFLAALGQILAYLTLFLIAIYSLAYAYLHRKYGGGSDEE